MKWLVFGSLNLDKTLTVDHIVAPGETLSAQSLQTFPGGKGFNQAVALSRAGEPVAFAGAVGEDGGMLLQALTTEGIDSTHVLQLNGPTGQALIQVNAQGENCIILLSGANGGIEKEHIDQVLAQYQKGDLILLQNEISNLPYIVEKAHALGLVIALNPSPFSAELTALIPQVDLLLLNEIEGGQLTGAHEPAAILDAMEARFPGTTVVLTLGGDGAWLMVPGKSRCFAPSVPCHVVDTTAAGDTFTGYFLSAYLKNGSGEAALRRAAQAASIAVSRHGAVPSIPYSHEL